MLKKNRLVDTLLLLVNNYTRHPSWKKKKTWCRSPMVSATRGQSDWFLDVTIKKSIMQSIIESDK